MKRKLVFAILALGLLAFLALNVRITYAEPQAAPRTTGYSIDWWMGAGRRISPGACIH